MIPHRPQRLHTPQPPRSARRPTGGARSGLFGRPILTVTIVLAALAGMGLGGVALANRDAPPGAPRWQDPPAAGASQAPASSPAASGVITMSATGDIIMGSAPNRLPANGGAGFFDSVKSGLASDLVMGNL